MFRYPSPPPVDLSRFASQLSAPEVKYGLPASVEYCEKCVISNQKPVSAVEFRHTQNSRKKTVHFEGGICDACRFKAKKRESINWEDRDRQLRELCDRHRRSDGSFDCLVPGSGGKDSFYTAHLLKYKYGMNPLTVTWAPHIYTEWGWRNFQRWIHSGFDNLLYTPNGRVHRLLTRLAVENLFHPFQPFFLGQKSLAPKLAVKYDIPLIFYGENEAEYGNPIASADTPKQDWAYFTQQSDDQVYVGGTSVADLKTDYGVSRGDLDAYMPADPTLLEKHKVEVHYFGYYLKWHPQSCFYYAVENGGFETSPERNPGTYSKYAGIDDKIEDFSFYTTYIKFGIGRATYDAAQELRSDDIERDEAVSLVKRFDGEFPERFAQDVFDYLSLPSKEFPIASKMFESPIMSREYFFRLTDQFRSPHLWMHQNGQWMLRHSLEQKDFVSEISSRPSVLENS